MSRMVEKLAYLKKLRCLTSEEIARRSGVPLGTLNKILSGQTKNPAVGPMDRICRVLGIPLSYLLDDSLPPERFLSANTGGEEALLLSQEEVRLLAKFRELDPRRQQAARLLIDLLFAPTIQTSCAGTGVLRLFCYIPAPDAGAPLPGLPYALRPILIPETETARRADFAALLSDGSMEPLYPARSVLLCRRGQPAPQEYGLFLLNCQQSHIRRLSCRRGVTKLVAPNLEFRDIVIRPEDRLECLGAVVGAAERCRWS